MALPSILLVLALLAAGAMAYGTDSGWGQFQHGVQLIIWSRRLQWPMLFAAVLLCLALVAMVIAGRHRAWWLLGLLPILALFSHRFLTGPLAGARVVEDPPALAADRASFLHDDDPVVGVRVGDTALAYPCSLLDDTPAVVQNDRQVRLLLMWSPVANLATAYVVDRGVSARDLDIVSTPDGALLLYDQRLGQFINSITGLTPAQQKPGDFRQPLATTVLPWSQWRQQNPATLVMAPPPPRQLLWPHRLAWPRYPLPDAFGESISSRRVCLVRTNPPIAIPSEAVTDVPLNLSTGGQAGTPVLLLRDLASGQVRAFDRHVETDLIPRFAGPAGAQHQNTAMVDIDTATEWSADGISLATTGSTHGKTLAALPVADGVSLAVLRFWYPDLTLIQGPALAAAVQAAPPPSVAAGTRSRSTQQQTRRRRRRQGG